MNAEHGPVQVAKSAYRNPDSFLNLIYQIITAGAEEINETAACAVESPTEATFAAAQVGMIILLFMAYRYMWRSSACFLCRFRLWKRLAGMAPAWEMPWRKTEQKQGQEEVDARLNPQQQGEYTLLRRGGVE